MRAGLGVVSVGLVDSRVEFFARGGMTEWEIDNDESDWESIGGVGGRITTNLDDELSWGVVGQILWASIEDRADDIDVDFREMQLGVGPSWHTTGLRVYGGVLVHFITGSVTLVLPVDDEEESFEFDFEEQANIGGYIGGALEFWEHLAIGVEYQQTADSKAIGAGIIWRF